MKFSNEKTYFRFGSKTNSYAKRFFVRRNATVHRGYTDQLGMRRYDELEIHVIFSLVFQSQILFDFFKDFQYAKIELGYGSLGKVELSYVRCHLSNRRKKLRPTSTAAA